MKYNLQICRFSILATFTVELFLTITVLLITQQVFAQFSDDFTDGDLTTSPPWSNASSTFVVASQELKLQAPATSGNAYITTPSRAIDMASWEFFVRLEFNPSTANNVRIYLSSDHADLTEPLNGYFILIGSAAHDVCLYRQVGRTLTKFIDGEDGKLDLPQINIRIKATRDADGHWTLLSDIGNTGTFSREGTGVDVTFNSSNYFGLLCSYSSTRSDKFHFDNFNVTGEFEEDVTPPELISAEAISQHEVKLDFNEDIQESTLQDTFNYSVIRELNNPNQVQIKTKRSVVIYFEEELLVGRYYTVTVSGLRDLSHNVLIDASREFRFLIFSDAQYKDVVITELMADPAPGVGLTENEFVELFNRSQNTFNLKGWQLMDDGETMILPDFVLEPASYVILGPSGVDFSEYGQFIYSDRFPTLNNSDGNIMLQNNTGVTIDSIHYTSLWYKDESKKTGGWSLELLDPENSCSEIENWSASESPAGGTPGKQNSLFASNPDVAGPKIIAAIPVSANTILLRFNEKLENILPERSSFSIEPAIDIEAVRFTNASLLGVELTVSSDLQPGISYSVVINKIYDCAGNEINSDYTSISFGMPEIAVKGDIVINEILFNPKPGGVDFIELVNTSSKYINLRDWKVGNVEQENLANAAVIVEKDFLLSPGAYLVLTENTDLVISGYPLSTEENILQVDQLPAFNDDEGSVGVTNQEHLIIDNFFYSKDMHSVFIKDPEGVSLERISLGISSSDQRNWKSANTSSGYATPGYVNSNAIADPLSNESINIEPEVLIPVTGQPDFVRILYKFDQGGYVANVNVQDEQGHLIKTIAQNELLGTEGYWRWDGDREDGRAARVGYYMVWLELYDADGKVITFKRRIAVSGKF